MPMIRLRLIGFWCGVVLVAFGLAYLGIVALSMLSGAGYPPAEPYQTLINILIILTAACMVVFWSLVHQATSPDKKLFSLISLVFIVIFATLTCINRYVGLTVVRQSLLSGDINGLQWFMPYGWPSVMLALEILAWGFFFGLACLCLAPAFTTGKLERAVSWFLILTGSLSMFATVGQVIGSTTHGFDLFTIIGMMGWGPGLTITVALITAWFRKVGTNST